MMKKHSWRIIFSLALLLFLTACSNAAPVAAPPAQAQPQVEPASPDEVPAANDETGHLQGTLRLSAPPWIFKKFPLEEVAQKFEADHPGVTVELTRVDKWNAAAYIPDWKNGTTSVDLYLGGTGSMLAPVIAGGWLSPLDDLLTGPMASDKFVGSFLAEGRYKKVDGSSYYPVIPFVGEVAMIGVNTGLMQKAELWVSDKPAPIPDWSEEEAFLAWFNKLQAQSPTGGHIQIWDREFMQYNYCAPIIAMKGTCLAEDGKGLDVTSAEARKWLGYVQKLHETGGGEWTTTFEDGLAKWKTGAAGSLFAAQSHAMELSMMTEKDSDIAYLVWPGAEKNGSVIWTHSVWIPKVSPNQELARAFIREQVFSPYFQQWTFNNYGKLPVIKEYYGKGITHFQDEIPLILAVAEASDPIPLFADMQIYLDILVKYLPEASYGRISVDEALSAIQQESQALDFTDLRAR